MVKASISIIEGDARVTDKYDMLKAISVDVRPEVDPKDRANPILLLLVVV